MPRLKFTAHALDHLGVSIVFPTFRQSDIRRVQEGKNTTCRRIILGDII